MPASSITLVVPHCVDPLLLSPCVALSGATLVKVVLLLVQPVLSVVFVGASRVLVLSVA